jgi:predicted nucleic acid-binding protein
MRMVPAFRREDGILLDAVAAMAEPVILDFLWRPGLPDADDDMVLETAVNGRADVIATFNIRDFVSAARSFGVVACTPGQAVALWERSA